MALPFFFTPELDQKTIVLDEDTSRHVAGVLRIPRGNEILLTDGKGKKALALLVDDHRKKCVVELRSVEFEPELVPRIAIGISLVKNTSRWEWFLEKATEIGINEIVPLVCDRTENEKFRPERMTNILVSAMLQSQQAWLPVLHQPLPFYRALNLPFDRKLIAHCLDDKKLELYSSLSSLPPGSSLILIGPEGDFTKNEVDEAIQNNFLPVTLGPTRLRTETAGMASAVLLRSLSR